MRNGVVVSSYNFSINNHDVEVFLSWGCSSHSSSQFFAFLPSHVLLRVPNTITSGIFHYFYINTQNEEDGHTSA